MNTLEFLASIVESIAWPAAFVVLVILLKEPLTGILLLLRKLKYKELELEFAAEVRELSAPTKLSYTQEIKVGGTNLEKLAEVSPRAAIIEAWLIIEAEASRVAASFWNESNTEIFRDYAKLGQYLHHCKVLDARQAQNFRKLRELRNKAAHHENMEVNPNAASVYVDAAVEIIELLRQI